VIARLALSPFSGSHDGTLSAYIASAHAFLCVLLIFKDWKREVLPTQLANNRETVDWRRAAA
jgi:hypothetical protein